MYYSRLYISYAVAILVLLLPFVLFAQDRATSNGDTGRYAETRVVEEVRADGTERSATNICDGVTCPDGSCAATIEECRVVAEAIVPIRAEGVEPQSSLDRDDDGDGIPDYRDLDSDGDGIPDMVEAGDPLGVNEGGDGVPIRSEEDVRATPYLLQEAEESGRVQERAGVDYVRPGTGDVTDDDKGIEKAQDYNSSRSNKARGAFKDVDIDRLPDVTRTRAGFIKFDGVDGESAKAPAVDDSGSLWCWGRAEAADGNEYRWGRGLCIALEVAGEGSPVAEDRLTASLVRGDDVRGWSQEEREAWRAYRSGREEDTDERLVEHMIERVQENERIQEIRADGAGVEMRYQTTLRLFGFIPLQRTVTARMDVGSIEPELVLPWYSFLTTKPDRATMRTLMIDTMDILVLVPRRAS